MKLAAFLLALFFLAANANAQSPSLAAADLEDLSLEDLLNVEVVKGVSRYNQSIRKSPASVTVYTKEEIRRLGFKTFNDLLNSTRGFFTNYDRNYDYVGVRGFARTGNYNTNVVLLVDGHRVNEALYDSFGGQEDFIINMSDIETVEFIRGPASSVYGNNALFGVISITTREAKSESKDEYALDLKYGSQETAKGNLAYRGTIFDWKTTATATYFNKEGHSSLYYREYDDSATNDGNAENSDRETSWKAFFKAANPRWTFEFGHVDREKEIPTGSYETVFNDDKNLTRDSKTFVFLRFADQIADDWKVSVKTSWDGSNYLGDYLYDNPPEELNTDKGRSGSFGVEGHLINTSLEKHVLSMGGELRNHYHLAQSNTDENGTVNLDHKGSQNNWGLFFNDEYAFSDELLFGLGFRYDWFSSFSSNLRPRGSVIYLPNPKTTLKLFYGEAFRGPNSYELYYEDDGNTQKPPEELEPEVVKTWETSVEYLITNNWQLGLSLFRNDMDNLINLTLDSDDGLVVYENSGSVFTQGFELESRLKFLDSGLFTASFTSQRAQDKESGRELIDTPRNLIQGSLIYPIIDQMFLGTNYHWRSKVKARDLSTVPSFGLVDLFLSTEGLWHSGLRLGLGIYNLLDTKYSHPVSDNHVQTKIEQDGRTFRVSAGLDF